MSPERAFQEKTRNVLKKTYRYIQIDILATGKQSVAFQGFR